MALPLSVAVVGSGPSGAYCARLLSQDDSLGAKLGRDRVKLHDRTRLLAAATIVPVSGG